jgi:hypothetical protein
LTNRRIQSLSIVGDLVKLSGTGFDRAREYAKEKGSDEVKV